MAEENKYIEDPSSEPAQKEMSFLDHLEELRWHIVRSVFAILLFTILLFMFPDILFGKIIFAPTKTDFWTFEMLCKLGEYLQWKVLCIEQFPLNCKAEK